MHKGTNIVIKDHRGKYLLHFRDSGTSHYPLHWHLFGGTIEEGETPEQNALREMKEELGVELAKEGIVIKEHVTTEDRAEYLVCYTQPIDPDQIHLGEGAGYGYFTPEEIAQLQTAPLNRDFIQRCANL